MKYWVLLSQLILFLNVKGQTIYKSWYSDSNEVCITIHKNGYSKLNETARIIIKKRKDKLIVIRRSGNSFLSPKLKAEFTIVKLTNDTLMLSRRDIPIEQRSFEELAGDIILFKSKPNGCVKASLIFPISFWFTFVDERHCAF